jgi:hypothetical protein
MLYFFRPQTLALLILKANGVCWGYQLYRVATTVKQYRKYEKIPHLTERTTRNET